MTFKNCIGREKKAMEGFKGERKKFELYPLEHEEVEQLGEGGVIGSWRLRERT